MLHGTLPRAFLPPVLQGFAGGYRADDSHQLYATAAGYVPCVDDPYARIHDESVETRRWETPGVRPMTPCPLDLSVRASGIHGIEKTDESDEIEVNEIEVDDETDEARCRATLRRGSFGGEITYSDYDASVAEENEIRRDSVRGCRSGDGAISRTIDETIDQRSSTRRSQQLREEILRGHRAHDYVYESVPMKTEIIDIRDVVNTKCPSFREPASLVCTAEPPDTYHSVQPKLRSAATSPSGARVHSAYHQLLVTPQHHLQSIHAPMTPPSTPSPPQCPRRRPRDESDLGPSRGSSVTPRQSVPPVDRPGPRPKKKHARKLKFDEDTSSPVSGTVILGPDEAVVTGDIDPAFNIVEVTEEARAELAKIENRLGPYQCKLCRHVHDDAFQLAQHRCSRIAHVEYRCPECDKRFSCPANLASHRRWHKPRIPSGENGGANASNPNASTAVPANRDTDISCTRCDAKFSRAAALRKHLVAHHTETSNDISIVNNNNNNNNNDDNNNSGFEVNGTVIAKSLCVAGALNIADASVTNETP